MVKHYVSEGLFVGLVIWLVVWILQSLTEQWYESALQTYAQTYESVLRAEELIDDRHVLQVSASCMVIPQQLPQLYVRWQQDLQNLQVRVRIARALETLRLFWVDEERINQYAVLINYLARQQRLVSVLADLDQRLLPGAIFCPPGDPV